MRKKVIIGTTKNSIVILEVDQDKHFSCSTDIIEPYTLEEAKQYTKEYWTEFFHMEKEEIGEILTRFKDQVSENIRRGMSAEEACAQVVLDIDGELHGFDMYEGIELTINNQTYVFQHIGGGQARDIHDEIEHYFVDKNWHSKILEEWDQHHLENNYKTNLEIPDQNIEDILSKAIKTLDNQYS